MTLREKHAAAERALIRLALANTHRKHCGWQDCNKPVHRPESVWLDGDYCTEHATLRLLEGGRR